MEVKKNLNNVQRKMLDTIYTEQFDKRAAVMADERKAGLDALTKKCLKTFASRKDVKKMMDAQKAFYESYKKLEKEMDNNGISLSNSVYDHELVIRNRYYGYERKEFPEIVAYQAATTAQELKLAEKKKEMRAKIYGVAASYEEVDQEIKELLKDI